MTLTRYAPHDHALLLAEQAQVLSLHLQHCRAERGRWFGAGLWAERAHGVLAPRFATILVLVTAALALLGGL